MNMAPDPMDLLAHLTPGQRDAVLTVDTSLLVSAAAGSGKTTVLAERCAALVCDVPDLWRCSVDELLVVTFTEAAAEEMRRRIASAIRKRLDTRPKQRAYLQQQMYLLDSASISTIHAFCRQLIQRWFPQAGVDPQLSILAEDEAQLLRQEVLDTYFAELYGRDDELGERFQTLVDDYAGGRDAQLVPVVLRLHAFVSSLPDPQGWLAMTAQRLDEMARSAGDAVLHEVQGGRLERELTLQRAYCQQQAALIRRCWPVAQIHAETFDEQAAQLEAWLGELAGGDDAAWKSVASAVRGHAWPRKSRPRNLDEDDKAAYESARQLVDRMKKVFRARVREAICDQTVDEYRAGLTCVLPYVRTLGQIVTEFGRRYQTAKTDQATADFNDLQRYAYDLLTGGDPGASPSDVARYLQRRYRYVLVDEFQDVDPLQVAILDAVSRERAEPAMGNMFTVGDIKQSIYRFRLAEPALFTQREQQFADPGALGRVIRLQENFRSRGEVLDAVNVIFRALMRGSFGGTDYDASAELRAGASYPADEQGSAFANPAIEFHVLEPITSATAVVEDEEENGGTDSPYAPDDGGDEELEAVEREAYLIGRRIQRWMGIEPAGELMHVVGRPESPGGEPVMRPVSYGDIVILLRSMPHKAEPMAALLRRMGIPVEVHRPTSDSNTAEINDVLSLLRVLDNQQQDIPLAAVLRSPICAERFSETELTRIRLIDRRGPFHRAVAAYVEQGDDESLGDKLRVALATLGRYRHRMQREPVARVLWAIYEETGYLAYVSGLPGGRRRRDHLLRLHEWARQFSGFARQGLRRFLRFVEQTLERGEMPQAAAGSGGDVVRIMTVHASKGLEFPVVILADLQKRFNLSDVQGPILIDREYGLALRAVDGERRIRYPTLIQQLAADETRREDLAEELRVLYVALTRAREHLVLVGRASLNDVAAARARQVTEDASPPMLSELEMEAATSPMGWLLPVVGSLPGTAVTWHGEEEAGHNRSSLFAVHVYPREQTDAWRRPEPTDTSQGDTLRRLAELEPLPTEEPFASDEAVEPIVNALSFEYPALELTTVPARVGVTELKRRWDATGDDQTRQSPSWGSGGLVARPRFIQSEEVSDAGARGSAMHRFMQLVDLARTCDERDLLEQREGLAAAGRLTAEEVQQINVADAAWFFGTELGREVRAAAERVHREVSFVAGLSPSELDDTVGPRDHQDVVLLRGIVDLLIAGDNGLGVVDYKTDRVAPKAVPQRATRYQTQMSYYAKALQAVHGKPIRRCQLVFLHARTVVDVEPAG